MTIRQRIHNYLEPPEMPVLWDRRFSLFVVGTAVSVLGNQIATFLLSLLVLDMTGSTFLYAVYLTLAGVTGMLGPLFSGVFLDRISRVKAIYLLDFTTFGVYTALAFLLRRGGYSIAFLFAICALLGLINSVYKVSYQSLLPMTIDPQNAVRAQSIVGVIETVSMLMVPVATFLYRHLDMWLLFLMCGIIYLIAACFETQIHVDEPQKKADASAAHPLKKYVSELGEGVSYLRCEKGLLALTLCELLRVMVIYGDNALVLPYYRKIYANGEYLYFIVMAFHFCGAFWAGMIGYLRRIKAGTRYTVVVVSFLLVAAVSALYLRLGIVLACGLMFLQGMAFQLCTGFSNGAKNNYIPNEFRGRYFGLANMLQFAGQTCGSFLAGFLSRQMTEPGALLTLCSAAMVMQILLMVNNRTDIRALFRNNG